MAMSPRATGPQLAAVGVLSVLALPQLPTLPVCAALAATALLPWRGRLLWAGGVLGMLLAILLTSQIVARGYLRSVVFFPVLVSTIGVGLTFTVLMNPDQGLINDALAVVGIDGPAWLDSTTLALPSLVVMAAWRNLGTLMVIFLAGLQTIPEELYEAAQLDGASWWQVQRRITIPLLGPTIRTWGFLSMIGSLQLFDMVWVTTKGGPIGSSSTMATFLYDQFRKSLFGYASAVSIVIFGLSLDWRRLRDVGDFSQRYLHLPEREEHGVF